MAKRSVKILRRSHRLYGVSYMRTARRTSEYVLLLKRDKTRANWPECSLPARNAVRQRRVK